MKFGTFMDNISTVKTRRAEWQFKILRCWQEIESDNYFETFGRLRGVDLKLKDSRYSNFWSIFDFFCQFSKNFRRTKHFNWRAADVIVSRKIVSFCRTNGIRTNEFEPEVRKSGPGSADLGQISHGAAVEKPSPEVAFNLATTHSTVHNNQALLHQQQQQQRVRGQGLRPHASKQPAPGYELPIHDRHRRGQRLAEAAGLVAAAGGGQEPDVGRDQGTTAPASGELQEDAETPSMGFR